MVSGFLRPLCATLGARAVLVSFVALLAANRSHAAYTYTIFDVPGATLGTSANDIQGDVIVGNAGMVTDYTLAFVRTGGTYATFSVNGAPYTTANEIDGGTIVGAYHDWRWHGFIKTGDSVTTLDYPTANFTRALGISGGTTVGHIFFNQGWRYYGFTYTDGVYTVIDVPGSTSCEVTDIFGDTMVGTFTDAAGLHGWVGSDGNFTTIDVPGAIETAAHAISGTTIAGYFKDAIGNHGFVKNGDLFTTIDVPGAIETRINGIDGLTVVGQFTDAAGALHGFAATPVPTPNSLSLFLTACPALLLARRRQ